MQVHRDEVGERQFPKENQRLLLKGWGRDAGSSPCPDADQIPIRGIKQPYLGQFARDL